MCLIGRAPSRITQSLRQFRIVVCPHPSEALDAPPPFGTQMLTHLSSDRVQHSILWINRLSPSSPNSNFSHRSSNLKCPHHFWPVHATTLASCVGPGILHSREGRELRTKGHPNALYPSNNHQTAYVKHHNHLLLQKHFCKK
uniref:Uncharacterized protein n=1 Tax=Globodera rostochiensis TaxID=31243 RepID=A0A914I625_GLORO